MSMNKLLFMAIIVCVAGAANAVFDPVAVKAKVDACKAQVTALNSARTTALAAKNSLDSALTPYKQYAATSTVVRDAVAKVNGWATVDAAYSQLMTYGSTTFGQAYEAYFSFNAQQIAKDISDSLGALKAMAATISSLIDKRTAAQDPFKEIVTGVAKPTFLGS